MPNRSRGSAKPSSGAAASGREVLAVDVGPLADEGFYVGPHIFADVPADARLAQEEVFGPVLAVIRGRPIWTRRFASPTARTMR